MSEAPKPQAKEISQDKPDSALSKGEKAKAVKDILKQVDNLKTKSEKPEAVKKYNKAKEDSSRITKEQLAQMYKEMAAVANNPNSKLNKIKIAGTEGAEGPVKAAAAPVNNLDDAAGRTAETAPKPVTGPHPMERLVKEPGSPGTKEYEAMVADAKKASEQPEPQADKDDFDSPPPSGPTKPVANRGGGAAANDI